MKSLLNISVFLPLAALLISVWISPKREGLIARVASLMLVVQLASLVMLFFLWSVNEFPVIDMKEQVLFTAGDYQFFIDFVFDGITMAFAVTGCMLTFLITVYSGAYVHREPGYKRFYNTILFFYFGYTLVIFSGNLETLFAGWEILGVSSFLLIAFYSDRYLPVKNAVKVFSIYRVGDVGLLLAMWMSHHLWHENITFVKLSNFDLVHHQLQSHTMVGVFISIMILIAAAAKSAQLPFSSWLPRAMEGPTPSSAIFYGSLSVHIGVFLLMRTFHFWEHQLSVRITIGLLGFVSSIVATIIARVQSSVKSQIAYSSIAQIGLIFIELACGWMNVALIHFVGNAFLRTYQLLISPSVVSYLIREQSYNFVPRQHTFEDSLPKRFEYTLYILSLKEWNLDSFLYRFLWNPLKSLGKRLTFLTVNVVVSFVFITLLLTTITLSFRESIPLNVQHIFTYVFSVLAVVFVLKSFTERLNVMMSWFLIVASHVCISFAVSFNELFDYSQIILYLSGVIVFGCIGWGCLGALRSTEKDISLDRFHGHGKVHKRLSFLFLTACLAVAGFPITPTFIGEDLVFFHIHSDQPILAALVAVTFIVDGLAIIRIYARVFLGPQVRSVYEVAYRSS